MSAGRERKERHDFSLNQKDRSNHETNHKTNHEMRAGKKTTAISCVGYQVMTAGGWRRRKVPEL